MERYRVRASFNGVLSPRASFQNYPTSHVSPPPKPHISRDPPISPYLRPEITRKTTGDLVNRRPPCDDAELSIFDAVRYFNEAGHLDDAAAKRRPLPAIILNGMADSFTDLSTNPRDSSASPADGYGRSCRTRSFHATPTASSEASWNSRTGLLAHPPGTVAVSVRALPLNDHRKLSRPPSGRRLFRRHCPCSGKKSVDVEEKYSEPKTPTPSHSHFSTSISKPAERHMEGGIKSTVSPGIWAKEPEVRKGPGLISPKKQFPAEIGHRIVNSGRPFVDGGGFSFPILAPPTSTPLEEPARDSLEVFRPKTVDDDVPATRKSADFPRRNYPASPKIEDDVASDASSDLFEIESLSTSPMPAAPYRRRDSLDELPPGLDPRRFVTSSAAGILQFRRSLEDSAPSIAASECYPPSEVSVEWSVTTAEPGFDRGSAANFSTAGSEYDEVRFIQAEHDRFAASMAAGGGKRKGPTGGLLSGCRCEKDVSVGPDPVRFVPEKGRPGIVLARSNSARVSRPVQMR